MVTTQPTTSKRPDGPPVQKWRIVILLHGCRADGPPRAIVLGCAETQIGRLPGCQIALEGDPTVSRLHATLLVSPSGTLRIRDERSREGTSVGNDAGEHLLRAGDVIELQPGDTITLGDSLLLVARDSAAAYRKPDEVALGVSPLWLEKLSLLEEMAPMASSVLLRGETGTGKEVAASFLHRHSDRASRPFVAVNCAALPDHLAERELFGHAKGGYTGADDDGAGRFEMAHQGTLFLDEIGDLPLPLQPKLLRVLQERQVWPIGAAKARPADVRLVTATHRDLQAGIKEGWFRADLYYRIAQQTIALPPIRERPEDLSWLLSHFVRSHAKVEHEAARKSLRPQFKPALLRALLRCSWMGNAREVESAALGLLLRKEPYDIADAPASLQPQLEALSDVHLKPVAPKISRPPPSVAELEEMKNRGMSKREISRVTDLDRRTLDRIVKRGKKATS